MSKEYDEKILEIIKQSVCSPWDHGLSSDCSNNSSEPMCGCKNLAKNVLDAMDKNGYKIIKETKNESK